MTRSLQAGFTLILTLFIGCSNTGPTGTTTDHASSGEHLYQYTGRNEASAIVVQGWLRLNVESDNRITGSWHLEPVNDSSANLPLGDGTLLGEVDTKGLASINLHPTFADNNLILIGILQNDLFDGQWSWITFAGPTKQGVFEAKP
jgi:hypothetical protein